MGALAKFIGVLLFIGSLYGSYQLLIAYGWIAGISAIPVGQQGLFVIINLVFYIISFALIKKE